MKYSLSFLNKQTKNKFGDNIHKNIIKGIESQKLHSKRYFSSKILRRLEENTIYFEHFF